MKRIYSVKHQQAFIEPIAETDWSEIYNVTSTEIVFHKKLMNSLKMFPQNQDKKEIS